jgi:hypothetical protein
VTPNETLEQIVAKLREHAGSHDSCGAIKECAGRIEVVLCDLPSTTPAAAEWLDQPDSEGIWWLCGSLTKLQMVDVRFGESLGLYVLYTPCGYWLPREHTGLKWQKTVLPALPAAPGGEG